MTGSVSAMTMTDVDRDALREGLRLVEGEVQRCERQSTEGAEPLRDSGFEGAVEEYARRARVLAAVAAVVRRELEAPGDDEALWREYEEAREEFENSAKLYQFAGDSESLSDLARDRARLDAAVRALAAVALQELERAGGRDAIAERLDALRRTIAAAHGLCIQCMERPRLEALRICGTCYRIGVPHGQDAA